MNEKKLSFQQENDLILNYILETSLLHKIKKSDEGHLFDFTIELYITSICNQKCDYCYLDKFGNELYPPEIRGEENILNNLKIYLEYLAENNYKNLKFELFSGEIWGMKFGNRVLDIILECIDNKNLSVEHIMIPSNMSFLTSQKIKKVIENYISKFKMRNVDFRFSISFDGKYLDSESRSYKDEKKNSLKNNEEFYDELFSFAKKYNYGFHPMVGAYKIENWKENYKWYVEKLNQYGLDPSTFLMLLEVRNDYWTQDKIDSYLDFLNYTFDYDIENRYNGDIKEFFADLILNRKNNSNYEPRILSVQKISLPSCTIHRSLNVRLGDLAIVPCHRTSYDKFIYGYYQIKNNKIVGLKANNIQLANRILLGTMNSHPKCSGCIIKHTCIKGCFGSQFEANGEILEPCETVCNLEKQKIFFVINKYEELGLMNDIKINIPNLYSEIEKIKNESEYKEWKKNLMSQGN